MRNLFFLLVLLSVLSCKKDKGSTLVLTGLVKDAYTGALLSDAEVSVSGQKLVDGVWSSTYTAVTTTTTDNAGRYKVSFDRANVLEYKVQLSKTKYMDKEELVSPETLSPEEENELDLIMYGHSVLRFNIENVAPQDELDELILGINSASVGCEDCCKEATTLYAGNVNEIKTCPTYGNRWVHYHWSVKENNQIEFYSDSVYCVAGDTADISIKY